MKLGIHSLLFSETFLEKDLPLLDKARAMGFDALEIIPFDMDNFPAAQVRQRAADLGLDINTGIGLPAEANPISPDPSVRAASIEYSKRLIDLSVEAGAKCYGGVIYTGWGYLSGKMRTSSEWNWAVEAFRSVTEYAHQADPCLVLAVEPLNRFESHLINTAGDAVQFVKDVGMPNAKVHLDTFHLIREENNIRDAVLVCGDLLGYVHACESQRGIPGSGLVPWREFLLALREVNYQGCVTVESFDPDMPNIAKLCCIWRKMAESPEQLATEGLRFLRELEKGLAQDS